ncbi:hypothetical protein J6590_045613, partial [Homalodisca vitripennis]
WNRSNAGPHRVLVGVTQRTRRRRRKIRREFSFFYKRSCSLESFNRERGLEREEHRSCGGNRIFPSNLGSLPSMKGRCDRRGRALCLCGGRSTINSELAWARRIRLSN